LVKPRSTTKIYGGYNPLNFIHSDGQWYGTSESFIFSFEDNNDTTNMKISRVVNTSKAMWEHYDNGFNFGSTFCLVDKTIYFQYTRYYDENVISLNVNGNNFIPEEIEVFKVNTL